jgi:hypothetical protein
VSGRRQPQRGVGGRRKNNPEACLQRQERSPARQALPAQQGYERGGATSKARVSGAKAMERSAEDAPSSLGLEAPACEGPDRPRRRAFSLSPPRAPVFSGASLFGRQSFRAPVFSGASPFGRQSFRAPVFSGASLFGRQSFRAQSHGARMARAEADGGLAHPFPNRDAPPVRAKC